MTTTASDNLRWMDRSGARLRWGDGRVAEGKAVSTCLSTYSLARETIHLFGTKPSAREEGYGQLMLTLIEKESSSLAVEMGDDPSATKWWANRGFQTTPIPGAKTVLLFSLRTSFSRV